MRVVAAVLFVALAGSPALAEEEAAAATPRGELRPARPKLPFRVIRTMPDTKQALVLDTERHVYVVLDVGGAVSDCTVVDIDDDAVTFDAPGGVELVMTVPLKDVAAATSVRAPAPAAAVVTTAPATTATGSPESPREAAAKPGEPAPIDPYAEPEVRVVEAPKEPADAAAAAVPAAAAAAVPAAAEPQPAPATDAPVVLSRAAVNSSLANFSQLAGSVHAMLTPEGVRLDWLAADSLFSHAGLVAHDLVVAVDGHALRTLDDAATLYARAASARNITVQVMRGGRLITLRIAIE